jgi:hypothetical protein
MEESMKVNTSTIRNRALESIHGLINDAMWEHGLKENNMGRDVTSLQMDRKE